MNPPYSTRYPDLRQLDAYYAERREFPPEGNLIVRNICCGPWIDIRWHADPKIVAVQNNMVDEDPFFVDAEGMDFQLRIDSPAYEIGFKNSRGQDWSATYSSRIEGIMSEDNNTSSDSSQDTSRGNRSASDFTTGRIRDLIEVV